MGRSRGGLTTKIHAVVDANGNPVALKLSEGQAHDGRSAADLLGSVGAQQILLADRAYDSDALRAEMARRGAWGPISSQCHAGLTFPPSPPGFTDTAIWSNASSASSSTFAQSLPDLRSTTRTIWHLSN